MIKLFCNASFDTPKPERLIERMLQLATSTSNDDLVIDFFAGSGTTAHAVLDLNKQDGGNRKFILVQLPEPTENKDYPTIADITKERVRRVIKKINHEIHEIHEKEKLKEPGLFTEKDSDSFPLDSKRPENGLDSDSFRVVRVFRGSNDLGFKVFKLSESNFKSWNAALPHDTPALERQLELHIDHIRDGRTPADLLYEILLKSGFPITTAVETVTMSGKTVHSIAGGALFICLERQLNLELIRAMADAKPERVVCLDEGFAGNDQLKANAVQVFKTKGVTSFKTV